VTAREIRRRRESLGGTRQELNVQKEIAWAAHEIAAQLAELNETLALRPPSAGVSINLDERSAELESAFRELARALGNPAVEAGEDSSLEMELVRLAIKRMESQKGGAN
jgi:hypothetical protein